MGKDQGSAASHRGSHFQNPIPSGEAEKTVSLHSPQQRSGLAYEALGPQVVLHRDDQGKVAGSQST